jgi:hypothetical protein
MERNKWRNRFGIASVWLAMLLWCMQGAVLAASERPSHCRVIGEQRADQCIELQCLFQEK